MNHPAYEANYVVSTLQSSHDDKSSRLSVSQNSDSPLITPRSQAIKRNSKTSTPYSFVEEDSLSTPCLPKKRQECTEGTFPLTLEPLLNTSYQANIEKSVQKFINRTNIDKGKEMEIDFPVELEPQHSPRFSTSGSGPRELNLPFLNEGPSTSQVVPESEPALSISQGSRQESLCRVDTVIQGMDASSQPSQELLKTVFSRCFSKDHFLNVLVGHDVALVESSDREMS